MGVLNGTIYPQGLEEVITHAHFSPTLSYFFPHEVRQMIVPIYTFNMPLIKYTDCVLFHSSLELILLYWEKVKVQSLENMLQMVLIFWNFLISENDQKGLKCISPTKS